MANITLKGLLNEVEDFKARSKESGKLVHFKSKDSYDAAIKAGSHEDPKAKKGGASVGVSKVAGKPNSMFGGDYAKDRGGETSATNTSYVPVQPDSQEVKTISKFTSTREKFIADFINKHKLDAAALSKFIEKGSLRDRMDVGTAMVGNPGNKYEKDLIKKFGAKEVTPQTKGKEIANDNIDALTSYKDFNKFFKSNVDKLDKKEVAYIEDEIGALKYLESDYKRGDADWEEVEVAYIELQDLIKKALVKNTSKSNMGVDKVVYNKRTNTVGIVRMADERGETKTDADGNVNTSELEPYNPMKYPHQKDAKVAPSTQKEVDARGLWNPFARTEESTKLKSMMKK